MVHALSMLDPVSVVILIRLFLWFFIVEDTARKGMRRKRCRRKLTRYSSRYRRTHGRSLLLIFRVACITTSFEYRKKKDEDIHHTVASHTLAHCFLYCPSCCFARPCSPRFLFFLLHYGTQIVDASPSIEEVHKIICDVVESTIKSAENAPIGTM